MCCCPDSEKEATWGSGGGGSQAKLWLNTAKMHVFDPQTGENLTRDEEAGAELTREANEERKADIERMRGQQA